MRKMLLMLTALLMVAIPISSADEAKPVYALVVKDTVNPYMQKMHEGFVAGCEELGAEPLLAGAEDVDPGAQARIIEHLIGQKVSAIAVAANDEAGLTEPLRRALDAGIKVVSVDSAADVGSRLTHIQQVDPTVLGRALMQAAGRMIGGTGDIAILSTTPTMPNQSTWVSIMLDEFRNNDELYKNMSIVEVAYGNDDREKSREETERLLDTYPNLKILIVPTSVGIKTAASVLRERGASVLVTGLGLPSEMEPFILSGMCPWMYLWNPSDTGYVAAYALDSLIKGQITGAAHQTLGAGRLGEKIITDSLDGGTEIVVGNPYKFDAGNILSWKSAF